jgi:hypothetical protein
VITDNKYLMIGAAVAGLTLAYMVTRGAGKLIDAVPKALNAINPLNNDNVINQAATSVYQGATGSAGTIGGDFYDATHGGMLDWGGLTNPTSENNVIYGGLSAAGEMATGQKGWSLGGAIYDWTH